MVMISPFNLTSDSDSRAIDCFNFDRIASEYASEHAKATSLAQEIISQENLQTAVDRYRLDELTELTRTELIDFLAESTEIQFNAEKELWLVTTHANSKKLAEQYSYAIITTYKDTKSKESLKFIDELRAKIAKEIEISRANLANYKNLHAQALREENKLSGTLLHYNEGYTSESTKAFKNMELEQQRNHHLKEIQHHLDLRIGQPIIQVMPNCWNERTRQLMEDHREKH